MLGKNHLTRVDSDQHQDVHLIDFDASASSNVNEINQNGVKARC
jgi:hypothetical protein